MGSFDVVSADGTRVTAWRNDGNGPAVLICNGLGTPPLAWPDVVADPNLSVRTWYYRGTGGGERPADPSRVTVADHVADALAVLDHEGVDRAVLACWSLGVNVGFELTRLHPDRVAGVLAVAGVPGGTFDAMGGPLGVPVRLRHGLGVAGARLGHAIGPALGAVARAVPLNRATATVINHSGFLTPAASPERLIPALEEFRQHDFRWYFTLALAASRHEPMDLSFVRVPVTLLSGRHDVLTARREVRRVAAQIPGARLCELPGSHFLPLEQPEQCHDELVDLVDRARTTDR